MKFVLLASLLCPGSTLSAAGARPQAGELAGLWVGALAFPDGASDLRARFEEGPDGLLVALTIVAEDARAILPVEVDPQGRMAFRLTTPEHGALEFTAELDGERATGSARLGAARIPFHLVRTADLSADQLAPFVGHYAEADGNLFFLTWSPHGGLARLDLDGPELRAGLLFPTAPERFVELDEHGQVARTARFERDASGSVTTFRRGEAPGAEQVAQRVAAPPFRMEEVRFAAGDGVELAGMLLLPAGAGPFPGLAYVHGSGADNTRVDHWDLAVCEHLARHGVAVLIPDKRGSGRSGGDWREADYARLADDALAAVRVLRRTACVRAERVGVAGLSQGGTIAPLVAARGAAEVAFVVALSGSGVDLRSATTFEVEEAARSSGAEEQGVAKIRAIQDAAWEWLGGAKSWEGYVAARAAALAASAPVRAVAQGFPDSLQHWKWSSARRVGNFDPLPSWQATRQPALVVWGAEDDLVPVEASAARLRAAFEQQGERDWTIRVFEGSGHALGDSSTGWIRKDFLDLLTDWVVARK